MTTARIYRPAQNLMQSGKARTKTWVLEYEPAEAKKNDPLMGWAGSGDMRGQLKLKFKSRAEAEAYAKRAGISYEIIQPNAPKLILKSYADRFAYDRVR